MAAQLTDNRPNPRCVFAPAKLNLGLRLIGRRADGYHLIESLFWPLDFGDALELREGKGLQLSAVWDAEAGGVQPALPQARENLVYRAAEIALGPDCGLDIRLRKRIPMGAGLGGGSSNAGSLLRHLVETRRISVDKAEKSALALGADVPFFLTNRPAWVEGIGEKRTPIPLAPEVTKKLTFLLILPPESTPTPVIFARYRALKVPFAPASRPPTDSPLDWPKLKSYLAEAENSLQGVAAMESSLVADILSQLKRVPSLYSGLSGTGSTCFAVFPTPEQARKTAQELQGFCRKSGCQSITAGTHTGPA